MKLQSIRTSIRTVQRKRPYPTNVLEYAFRNFGLNRSEGQESLNNLLLLGTVYNKPTAAGLPSLFVKKDNDVNNPEIEMDRVDEKMSNSFLDCSKEHEVAHNGPIDSNPTVPFAQNSLTQPPCLLAALVSQAP